MTDKELVKQVIVNSQARLETINSVERNMKLPIDSGKIITVPGVRRCGKSTLLLLTIKQLLAKGIDRKQILFFNFDDERIKCDGQNLDSIIVAYRELYPDIHLHNVYMFFDEVQMASDWQSFVRRIYEEECRNIYITGSNSQMLSSELATVLRGRSLQYEEFPLSFDEVCRFCKVDINPYSATSRARLASLFDEYLMWGGFPEVVMADKELRDKILSDYYYVMLYRDMVEHFNINPATVARYYIRRVMENVTKPTSINKIYNELKSMGVSISKDRAYTLAEQCEAIYLFLPLSRYTASVQSATTSDTKFYCIDNGLRKLTLKPQSDDNGKMLENAVYLHLRRSLDEIQKLTYFKGNGECDFVISCQKEVKRLVQVTWDMSEPDTYKHELSGLLEASKATGCTDMCIVTHDDEKVIETEYGIVHVVPAWKWTIMQKKGQP